MGKDQSIARRRLQWVDLSRLIFMKTEKRTHQNVNLADLRMDQGPVHPDIFGSGRK
jgi:hypothetical protein